jgi:formimidoylglutamate deiminase
MPRMQGKEGSAPASVRFAHLWWEGRWLREAEVAIGADGLCATVTPATSLPPQAGAAAAAPGVERIEGYTLPGIVDAHSHAFQRPLGAWTQHAHGEHDDFWTWRQPMYALARVLRRDELEAIAARCFLDLLRGGYTEVAEFLYLHRMDSGSGLARRRGGEGAPDADLAIVAAAHRTGVGLTLLPTLYQHADFGGRPPTPGQLAFARSTPEFLADWQELKSRYSGDAGVRLGAALHSLRAVDIDEVERVAAGLLGDPACRCLHMHVAEQPAEVAACTRVHGLAPVALLASRGLLGPRWALVHGTHATPGELDQMQRAGATLVLCPTTEADLGDGCPQLADYLAAGGMIAVGSDSNVGRIALAELRQLEWSQRLAHGRRNVLAGTDAAAVADRLLQRALRGGWRAVGQERDNALPRADFVTYDDACGDVGVQPDAERLAALVFDAPAPEARQVMVAGRWVLRDGQHPQAARIDADYTACVREVRARLGDWH